MSCETLENAVKRMKLVCELGDVCGDGRGGWCSEHHDCDECHADAFQHVLDAFDRERELISEREYHRGYTDGKQAKLTGNTREDGDAEHGCGGGDCEPGSCDRGDCGGDCADVPAGVGDLPKSPEEMSVGELIDLLKESYQECVEGLEQEVEYHKEISRLANRDCDEARKKLEELIEKNYTLRQQVSDLTNDRDEMERRLEELSDAGITSLHRLLREAVGDAKNVTDTARHYVEKARKSRKSDPEREAVIERLRKLDFTQKNVSVYEIVCVVLGYEPAPWWNRENSAELRDKLIELLSDGGRNE